MGGTADKPTRVSGEGDKIGARRSEGSRKGLKRRGDIFGGGAEGGGFVPAVECAPGGGGARSPSPSPLRGATGRVPAAPQRPGVRRPFGVPPARRMSFALRRDRVRHAPRYLVGERMGACQVYRPLRFVIHGQATRSGARPGDPGRNGGDLRGVAEPAPFVRPLARPRRSGMDARLEAGHDEAERNAPWSDEGGERHSAPSPPAGEGGSAEGRAG